MNISLSLKYFMKCNINKINVIKNCQIKERASYREIHKLNKNYDSPLYFFFNIAGTKRNITIKRKFFSWKDFNFLTFLWFLGIFVFVLIARKLFYEKNKVFRYFAKIQTFDD